MDRHITDYWLTHIADLLDRAASLCDGPVERELVERRDQIARYLNLDIDRLDA